MENQRNSDQVLIELQEYVVYPNQVQEGYSVHETSTSISNPNNSLNNSSSLKSLTPDYKWTIMDTKTLIDLYSKYHKKVGTFQIRNQKQLWEIIANEMKQIGLRVTSNNCLNRWRVVERNYKKFVDNQNKTGRGRKFFDYEEEMVAIFGKKKNILPEILLDSQKVDTQEITEERQDKEQDSQELAHQEQQPVAEEKQETPRTKLKAISSKITPRSLITKRISSVEKFRQDKKNFYNEKLQIEKLKLEEIKKRNKLIAERNEILKKLNCNCNNSIL